MSKNLSFIKLSDKYRTLLTDVLPYETPLIFSNEGFYSLIKELSTDKQLFETINSYINERFGQKNKRCYIPYLFSIIRKDTKKRKLSLPHPISQLELCDLYEDYADYITYLCSKSNFSLRYPHAITSKFYKKGCLSDVIENENENSDLDYIDQKTASNYFVYERYGLLYLFYDSKQFCNLEKKYQYLRKLDITNCFSSIYTHTICWAVRTKELSKNDTGKINFENEFDKFMQNTNYKETAGIIIGPEFSRIFAEIIFQRIDVNIENKLLNEYNLKLYKDYEIYRYVDDIFIFSNKIDFLNIIEDVIQDELDPYRLHLNDNKEKDYTTPFASDVSAARDEINFLFNEISSTININKNEITFNSISNFNLIKFSSRLKNILYRNNSSITSVDSFIFNRLKKIIDLTITNKTEINSENKKNALKWIETILEISFYIFSLDIRINASNKLSYILVNIHNFMLKNNFNKNDINNINKIIFDEIFHIIKKEISNGKKEFIEVINLLLILKSINFSEKIPKKTINEIINQILNQNEFDYFSFTTLLAFTSHGVEYRNQRKKLIEYVQELKFDIHKTEHFLLIFDYLTYPDITIKEKKRFLRRLNSENQLNLDSNKIKNIVNYLSDKIIFTDWSNNIDFNKKLKKKEFVTPYE